MRQTMSKRLGLLVGLIGLAAATPTFAADMAARTYTKAPPKIAAVYNWTGFYIGANAGYGSSRMCGAPQTVAGNGVVVVVAGLPGFNTTCGNANGALAGGQFGYRWQTSAWVFGIEAQGDWANLKGTVANATLPALFSTTGKVNGFGLFTGSIGYAWDNVLLYAKGGAAVTGNKFIGNSLNPAVLPSTSASETRWGAVAGAGLEIGFAPNWSVGFEYDHLFMGSRNLTFALTPAIAYTTRVSQDVDMGTVRVNYRFGGPVVAKY
jgi:outer membrane immunogenic protein